MSRRPAPDTAITRVLRWITVHVPWMRPRAPKRNVLLALVYAFIALLLVGVLAVVL
jgi:hypothetical protein